MGDSSFECLKLKGFPFSSIAYSILSNKSFGICIPKGNFSSSILFSIISDSFLLS